MAGSMDEALREAKAKNAGTFDVMIDIETMGGPPNGALCSVGLIRFNRHTGDVSRCIHLAIKLQTSIEVGMKVDASTILWWAMQHPDAGRALSRGAEDIGLQLSTLSQYFTPQDTVWAGPVSFDLVILRRAYELTGLAVPWEHEQEHCLTKLVKDVRKKHEFVTKVERHGTHHNAQDDAYTQALRLIDITANV